MVTVINGQNPGSSVLPGDMLCQLVNSHQRPVLRLLDPDDEGSMIHWNENDMTWKNIHFTCIFSNATASTLNLTGWNLLHFFQY